MTTKTIAFAPPLTTPAGPLAQIVLREPTIGELLKAEREVEKFAGIVAEDRERDAARVMAVAGIARDAYGAIPARQAREAAEFLKGFISAPSRDASPEPDLQIVVDPPIELHNRTCDLIELREPTAGEVDAAYREMGARVTELGVRQFQVMLIARVSGVPRPLIERLPITLADQASRYLLGFT